MNDLIKQVQEACADVCDKRGGAIAQIEPSAETARYFHAGIESASVRCAAAIRALDLSHLSKASNAESITMDDLSAKLAEFIAIKSPDKDEWYGPENEMYRDCINEFLDFVDGYPAP